MRRYYDIDDCIMYQLMTSDSARWPTSSSLPGGVANMGFFICSPISEALLFGILYFTAGAIPIKIHLVGQGIQEFLNGVC